MKMQRFKHDLKIWKSPAHRWHCLRIPRKPSTDLVVANLCNDMKTTYVRVNKRTIERKWIFYFYFYLIFFICRRAVFDAEPILFTHTLYFIYNFFSLILFKTWQTSCGFIRILMRFSCYALINKLTKYVDVEKCCCRRCAFDENSTHIHIHIHKNSTSQWMCNADACEIQKHFYFVHLPLRFPHFYLFQ